MRRKLRILGNNRAYMMLARDVRRRWLQYGENRKAALNSTQCANCQQKKKVYQVDHIKPLGARPRCPEDFCTYIYNMFHRKCQSLCIRCHHLKTKKERPNVRK